MFTENGETTKNEIPFSYRVFAKIYKFYASQEKFKDFEELVRLNQQGLLTLPMTLEDDGLADAAASSSVRQKYNELLNPFAHLNDNSSGGEKSLAAASFFLWTPIHSLALLPQFVLQNISVKLDDWSNQYKLLKPLKLPKFLLDIAGNLYGNVVAFLDNLGGTIPSTLKGETDNAKDSLQQAGRNALSIALPTAIGVSWAVSGLPGPEACMEMLHTWLVDSVEASAMLATAATWLAVLASAIAVATISYKINQGVAQTQDFVECTTANTEPYTPTPLSQVDNEVKHTVNSRCSNPYSDQKFQGSPQRSQVVDIPDSQDSQVVDTPSSTPTYQGSDMDPEGEVLNFDDDDDALKTQHF